MSVHDDDGARVFRVVRNGEEQFSIWPVGRDIPAGWTEIGFTGPKAECLTYIDRSWAAGWPGGISPPGSHRTERESLPSLRSSHL